MREAHTATERYFGSSIVVRHVRGSRAWTVHFVDALLSGDATPLSTFPTREAADREAFACLSCIAGMSF